MNKAPDKHTVSLRELRQFGLGLGLLGCLVGGLLLWNGQRAGALVTLIGLALGAVFWLDLPGVRLLHVGWMKVAGFLGQVMTRVLLTLLFFLVLTPIAWLGRLCGQRFVERGFRENCDSYWLARSPERERRSYEKQS